MRVTGNDAVHALAQGHILTQCSDPSRRIRLDRWRGFAIATDGLDIWRPCFSDLGDVWGEWWMCEAPIDWQKLQEYKRR